MKQVREQQRSGTEQFLKLVVPEGYIVIAWQEEGGRFRNTAFESHEEAAKKALRLHFKKNDVFYAMASFKQGWHKKPDGQLQLRTADNINKIRSFWYDVDIKPGNYSSKADALKSLKYFLDKSQLPEPTIIVSSGNGLHIYWITDADLTLQQWRPLAEAFKYCAQELNFKADLKCTSDAARVLRPIGTSNFKHGNTKSVELLGKSAVVSIDVLNKKLAKWKSVLPPLPPSKTSTNYDLVANAGIAFKPSFTSKIVTKCAVMGEVADNHGAKCDEPLWKDVLNLVRFTQDGDDWVHPLSDGHESYTFAATQQKYEQRKLVDIGPTTCKSFSDHCKSICDACPYNGKIKSPILLGTESFRDPDELPSGWRVHNAGWGIEEEVEDEWVFRIPFLVSKPVFWFDADNEGTLSINIRHKGSNARHTVMPTALLGSANKMSEWLAINAFPIPHKPNLMGFMRLMTTWLKNLREATSDVVYVNRFGWDKKAKGFSLGKTTYFDSGKTLQNVQITGSGGDQLIESYSPHGSLEAWKAVAELPIKQNNIHMQMVMGASFGAPLVRFLPYSGGLLNLFSSQSGVGKSTSIQLAQSIWGKPTEINSLDDTQMSLAARMGVLNNLPAFWDEIRGESAVKDFAKTAFQVSQGREKSRLTSGAQMRKVHSWETLAISASNDSLFEAVGEVTKQTDAGQLRVFEVAIPTHGSTDNIMQLLMSLRKNYGVAGVVYCKKLLSMSDKLEQIMLDEFARFADSTKSSHEERFWLTVATSAYVGAKIAKSIGLVDFNLEALHDLLVGEVNRSRYSLGKAAHAATAEVILGSYLQDHQGDKLVTENNFTRNPTDASTIIRQAPDTRRAFYQIDINTNPTLPYDDSGSLLVSTQHLKRWLKREGFHYAPFIREMKADYGAKLYRTMLGRYTQYVQIRTTCIVIPGNSELKYLWEPYLREEDGTT